MANAHEEAKELLKECADYVRNQNFSAREIDNLHKGKLDYRDTED